MASYYRHFIHDFAMLAKPLYRHTERGTKFLWTNDCDNAFKDLRQRLLQAPIMTHPDFNRPFILDTDASDVGIGAVLTQVGSDGLQHVIAFGSRLLTKAEWQYCVTHKELLAVVNFIQQYRPYLLGRKFTLRTDHSSLMWLKNFREPEGQLARWLEKLQEFNFTIVHRNGRKHGNADALSRLPCRQCGRKNHESHDRSCCRIAVQMTTVLPLNNAVEGLRAAQLADTTLGPLLQGKESCHKPTLDELGSVSRYTRHLIQIWDQLQVHSGVLCRMFVLPNSTEEPRVQQIIPSSLQEEVLMSLHEGATLESKKH